MAILPPPLKLGDTIGVMAPSSYVEREDIEAATAFMEARGYKVFVHPQTYERHNQSAGTALQKALALQGLWQRDDIDVIWCARGGNRAMHFVDSINFEKMAGKPKALIGFSDVTVLLNALYAHTGIVGYHGPVFKEVHKHAQLEHSLRVLAGEETAYDLNPAEVLKAGNATGHLIGGNLSLFQYLPQTLPGEFWEGGILFLEDCGEETSRLDRMLLHLKRIQLLDGVSGIIFGEFSGLKDTGTPYGFSWRDIVLEHTEGLDIPVILGAPFGHGDNLYTFPVGREATLDTEGLSLKLTQP